MHREGGRNMSWTTVLILSVVCFGTALSATRSTSYYPYNSDRGTSSSSYKGSTSTSYKGSSSSSYKAGSSSNTRRQGTTSSNSAEKQNNLLNLLGFNRWENMINRFLTYDQMDCVPRMICEAVVDRNTSSPIFSNLANQLPQVFGGQGGINSQLLLQQQQQSQQQQPALSHDPFNGLTTGGGGNPSSVESQQQQQPAQSQLPSSPQNFIQTFLSQIGIGGTTTTQSPILTKLFNVNAPQLVQQQQQVFSSRPHNLPVQLNNQAIGPNYQLSAAGSNIAQQQVYAPQFAASGGALGQPGGSVSSLASLLSSGISPTALAAATQQLQQQYQLNPQQQQLLNSFPPAGNGLRPSGSVSFRELKRRSIDSKDELEVYQQLFMEGVHKELHRRNKRQLAIQVGSPEQLFNVFRRVVGEDTASFKLADAAYQGTRMITSRECREHYKECPTDALGWIEALAKLQLPSINFG